MSRKNVVRPHRIIDNVALTDGLASAGTKVPFLDGCSYQIEWSSNTDGTGNFVVEGSNWDERPLDTQKWSLLDFDPIPLSGASGDALVNINAVMFKEIRIRYIETVESTGGLVTITVMAKSVGA